MTDDLPEMLKDQSVPIIKQTKHDRFYEEFNDDDDEEEEENEREVLSDDSSLDRDSD